jgi:hypothetical protein
MHEPSIQLKDPIPNVQFSKSLLIKLGQKHAQSLQNAGTRFWGIASSSFLLLFVEYMLLLMKIQKMLVWSVKNLRPETSMGRECQMV